MDHRLRSKRGGGGVGEGGGGGGGQRLLDNSLEINYKISVNHVEWKVID